MKKKSIFIIALAGFSLFSCKDFLDVKPTNSIDSGETITTVSDAKVMTNGLIRSLGSVSYYGRNFMLYGDTKGGDLTIASQGRGLDALYTFNHSIISNDYGSFWTIGYYTLLQANNIIESIDELVANGSTLDFDTYKGQALTIRALIHFDLVRLYGKSYTDDAKSFGIPIANKKLPDDAKLLRSSVSEVYTQITSDLTAAESLLPKTKTNGYINYYANKALQARVYLTMGDYEKALSAAEEVIGSTIYSLYDNAKWEESWAAQFGSESLFEIALAKDQGDLGSSSLGFYYLRSKENNALGNFIASDYYLERLNQDEDDVRWSVMGEDELGRKGSLYKYVGGLAKKGDGKDVFTAVNIKVIRLSEVYLIAAESALQKSGADKDKAANYLNKIRKRSPNLAPATAANITLDMILEEKSKELYGEGQRFWDMIRTNKTIIFNDEHVGVTMQHREKSINRSFFKTLLPIPRSEIEANPEIEKQQNPGY